MKNMKLRKILTAILALCLIFAAAGCKADNSSNAPENPPKQEESTAPSAEDKTEEGGAFEAMDTVDLNSESVDSSAFADNKLTMINVWNAGCTPCIMELPELEKLSKDYAEKGIAIKGLVYTFHEGITDEERTEHEEILKDAGVEYQQLLLSEGMLNSKELKQLEAFPTSFFVDSEGKIIDTILGSNDYDGWKKVIDKMLENMDNE